MTTLYKNTSRLAASILTGLVLSTTVALALTHRDPVPMAPAHEVTDLGRFVVTPTALSYAAAPQDLGRILVTPQRMAIVLAADAEAA